ncbi:hypothetical protein [Candidatus Pantoea persica]
MKEQKKQNALLRRLIDAHTKTQAEQ